MSKFGKQPSKFIKRPVVIDAIQFGKPGDIDAIRDFVAPVILITEYTGSSDMLIIIPTLEGDMRASLGDWIIRGVNGEYYPCKPYIFEKTYDPIDG